MGFPAKTTQKDKLENVASVCEVGGGRFNNIKMIFDTNAKRIAFQLNATRI